MAYINVDASAVEDFQYKLNDKIHDLEQVMKDTHASIDTVGETWKDDQFQKFREIFESNSSDIKSLVDLLSELENDLAYYLRKLREYDEL